MNESRGMKKSRRTKEYGKDEALWRGEMDERENRTASVAST
jgi:hypothetical protein